ncbi:hypothetical protein BC830DRAFT_549929 [Chytriomyces sp. MP71]|nr:hypothetical protein BC830DRAFT_549929 [Chytriomyces sp. MP71]
MDRGLHIFKCIQERVFAEPRVHNHPSYPDIHVKLNNSNFTVLELGCCYGTDARKMLSDGLDESRLTVSDVNAAYFELGNSVLFRSPLNGVKRVFGDLAVPVSESDVVATNGMVAAYDAVSCQAILHVLSKAQLNAFLGQMFRCLKQGGILFGTCVGSFEGGAREWGVVPSKGLHLAGDAQLASAGTSRFLLDSVSLEALLKEVGFSRVDVVEDAWEGTSPAVNVGVKQGQEGKATTPVTA